MGLSWYVYGKSPKDNVLVSHNRHSKTANNDLASGTKPKTNSQSSLVSLKEQKKKHLISSVYSKATDGEVLILCYHSNPIFVSRSFIVSPLPFVMKIEKFNVEKKSFKSRFCEVTTRDYTKVTLDCAIEYEIDTSNDNFILKAYKFLF